MTPEEKVVAKRQAVMAVLDEDWPKVLSLVLKLSNASVVDPETCGHEFERLAGLPNAVCKRCGAELVPRKILAPLFGEEPPQKEARGPEEVRTVKDTPCPNRGLGHAWMIFDTYVDRCAACKATRPRPKSAAAPASAIGDPSDL